jgi:hypothetical protein
MRYADDFRIAGDSWAYRIKVTSEGATPRDSGCHVVHGGLPIFRQFGINETARSDLEAGDPAGRPAVASCSQRVLNPRVQRWISTYRIFIHGNSWGKY